MIKTIIGSFALITIVIGIGAAIGYQKYRMMSAPPPANEERPEIVVYANPKKVTIRQTSTAVGTILARRSLQLRTEVVGTISEITFTSGQIVNKNQVLLKLDTSVEEAQLQSAEAAEEIAKSTLARNVQAAEAKAISDLELEQSKALWSQAKAEVMRLKAIINKKTLRAPFDARAGLFDVHPGQYLPEGTQITMLQGVDDYVHVDFMMPQQVADEVHVGDEVRLIVEPTPLTAEIIAIDSQSDRITRNLPARAKLKDPPQTLQPNDSIRIELAFGQESQAYTIPAAGLRRSPTGPFVYLVSPDPKDPKKDLVHIQPVVPGKTIGQDVAILSGITDKDTIVSDGSFKLREDLWVVNVEKPSDNPVAPPAETTSP